MLFLYRHSDALAVPLPDFPSTLISLIQRRSTIDTASARCTSFLLLRTPLIFAASVPRTLCFTQWTGSNVLYGEQYPWRIESISTPDVVRQVDEHPACGAGVTSTQMRWKWIMTDYPMFLWP